MVRAQHVGREERVPPRGRSSFTGEVHDGVDTGARLRVAIEVRDLQFDEGAVECAGHVGRERPTISRHQLVAAARMRARQLVGEPARQLPADVARCTHDEDPARLHVDDVYSQGSNKPSNSSLPFVTRP